MKRTKGAEIVSGKASPKISTLSRMLKCWQLYVFLLPAVAGLIIFAYVPMYGVQLAFKDYHPIDGIWGSPFVGFEHFSRFFNSPQFFALLKNTLAISIYALVVGFPIPVLLALGLNQVLNMKFKKTVQTVTYAPYFISTVVLVGILNIFLSTDGGLVNTIIGFFGKEPILFMGQEKMWRHIYVWSGIWQNMGWNAVIYIAALAGVSPEHHEAAIVDGATKLQRIIHIDFPAILPTIVITLILNCGSVMSIGFEKAYLMQNPLNLGASEIIATYIYKVGLVNAEYGYSTAVGLFNSVVNCILLLAVNKVAKKMGQSSLW